MRPTDDGRGDYKPPKYADLETKALNDAAEKYKRDNPPDFGSTWVIGPGAMRAMKKTAASDVKATYIASGFKKLARKGQR